MALERELLPAAAPKPTPAVDEDRRQRLARESEADYKRFADSVKHSSEAEMDRALLGI